MDTWQWRSKYQDGQSSSRSQMEEGQRRNRHRKGLGYEVQENEERMTKTCINQVWRRDNGLVTVPSPPSYVRTNQNDDFSYSSQYHPEIIAQLIKEKKQIKRKQAKKCQINKGYNTNLYSSFQLGEVWETSQQQSISFFNQHGKQMHHHPIYPSYFDQREIKPQVVHHCAKEVNSKHSRKTENILISRVDHGLKQNDRLKTDIDQTVLQWVKICNKFETILKQCGPDQKEKILDDLNTMIKKGEWVGSLARDFLQRNCMSLTNQDFKQQNRVVTKNDVIPALSKSKIVSQKLQDHCIVFFLTLTIGIFMLNILL